MGRRHLFGRVRPRGRTVRAFHGDMSDQPNQLERADPNMVLRGGPLDGEKAHVDGWIPISIEVGDERCVYQPTRELDSEFDTLAIWVFDHSVPA